MGQSEWDSPNAGSTSGPREGPRVPVRAAPARTCRHPTISAITSDVEGLTLPKEHPCSNRQIAAVRQPHSDRITVPSRAQHDIEYGRPALLGRSLCLADGTREFLGPFHSSAPCAEWCSKHWVIRTTPLSQLSALIAGPGTTSTSQGRFPLRWRLSSNANLRSRGSSGRSPTTIRSACR